MSDIDNVGTLYKDAKKMMTKTKDGYELFGHEFRVQNDLKDRLRAEPEFEHEIMQKVVSKIREEDD